MATPRHHTPRSGAPTRGAAAGVLARAMGRPFMPWQQHGADVALELGPDGHYWYSIVVVTVPRQSGKTELEGIVSTHRCLTTRGGRVWITMQNGKAADEWMRDEHHTRLADSALFRGRYTASRRAGSTGVRWPATGSLFTAFPPTRDALHGKQGDLVIIDEAWAHDAERGADLRQAVRPTMATRPGAQLWIVSTAGDDTSTYLDGYIDAARASLGDPTARICFIDYGIRDDDDPEDLEAVAAAHPAVGHTITIDALAAARADFGRDSAGWARAYGNRPTRSRVAAFPPGVWAAAGRPRTTVPDRAGIGLDVTPSGDRAAVAAGWRDPSTAEHRVELVVDGPATRELPQQLAQLARTRGGGALTVDRASIGALDVADHVAALDPSITITYTSAAEFAAACSVFERDLTDGALGHHQQKGLDDAVDVAVRRPLGDGGWAWGRARSSGSIAPLVAATLAHRAGARLAAPLPAPMVVGR